MIKVNTKDFLHNFAKYKKKIRDGKRIVVCENNIPVLDVTPHQEHISQPGWKRDHFVLPVSSKAAVKTLLEERREKLLN